MTSKLVLEPTVLYYATQTCEPHKHRESHRPVRSGTFWDENYAHSGFLNKGGVEVPLKNY